MEQKFKMKSAYFHIFLVSISQVLLSSSPVRAQTVYASPPLEAAARSEGTTFSINTGELSCTSAAGTPQSFFIGAQVGNGNIDQTSMTEPMLDS